MTMASEALAQIDKALDTIRQEAKEYVTSLDEIKIKTTKDNYGPVLAFLTKLKDDADADMAKLFLIAMVGAGYPLETASQLNTLFGWPATIDSLLTREYLKVVAA
jgi:hypothetical protein